MAHGMPDAMQDQRMKLGSLVPNLIWLLRSGSLVAALLTKDTFSLNTCERVIMLILALTLFLTSALNDKNNDSMMNDDGSDSAGNS